MFVGLSETRVAEDFRFGLCATKSGLGVRPTLGWGRPALVEVVRSLACFAQWCGLVRPRLGCFRSCWGRVRLIRTGLGHIWLGFVLLGIRLGQHETIVGICWAGPAEVLSYLGQTSGDRPPNLVHVRPIWGWV